MDLSSNLAPLGSTISFKTFPLPPAPYTYIMNKTNNTNEAMKASHTIIIDDTVIIGNTIIINNTIIVIDNTIIINNTIIVVTY